MSDPYADDAPEGRIQLGFLRQLWPFARPYRRGFAACLGILFVSFALELLGPWVLRHAIDGPMRGAGPTDERLRALGWHGLAFLGARRGSRAGRSTRSAGRRRSPARRRRA